MSVLSHVLWIVVGLILIGWGFTAEQSWVRWTLVILGTLAVVLNVATLVRERASKG